MGKKNHKFKIALKYLIFLSLGVFQSKYSNAISNKEFYHFEKESLIIPESVSKGTLFTYSNGLKLIVIPEYKSSFATIHFMVDAGSNRETKQTAGLAHFFEHMAFRKSKMTPEGNFDRTVKAVGGKSNAFTYKNFVTYFVDFPAPAIDMILQSTSHLLQNVELTEPYFSIEKGAVLSERKLSIDNNALSRAEEKLNVLTERETFNEWPLIGHNLNIQNYKIKEAEDFFNKFYTPSNTIIVIGGPFSPKEAAKKVSTYFSSWKKKPDIPHQEIPQNYYNRDYGKRFVCKDSNISDIYYEIVYPSNQVSIKDYTYFQILKHLLYHNKKESFYDKLYDDNYANNFLFYKDLSNQKVKLGNYYARFYIGNGKSFDEAKILWEKYLVKIANNPITKNEKQKILDKFSKSNAIDAEKLSTFVEQVKINQFLFNDFSIEFEQKKIIEELDYNDFSFWIKENLNINKSYIKVIDYDKNESLNCR